MKKSMNLPETSNPCLVKVVNEGVETYKVLMYCNTPGMEGWYEKDAYNTSKFPYASFITEWVYLCDILEPSVMSQDSPLLSRAFQPSSMTEVMDAIAEAHERNITDTISEFEKKLSENEPTPKGNPLEGYYQVEYRKNCNYWITESIHRTKEGAQNEWNRRINEMSKDKSTPKGASVRFGKYNP